MKIIDITPETESHFFFCLEEWSDDMKEAGDCKRLWYEKMKDKGLKVKFAVDDNNVIGGMIQYIPVEYSMFEGNNLYAVLCIWVHGHKKGRGDYRKKGMGKALLNAAEEDAKQLGANGLVTWGLIIPAFMRASWFKKQGYKVVDKTGIMRLMLKPFNENAIAPQFRKPVRKPDRDPRKVNLTIIRNGWCQSGNISCERAKRAAIEFKDNVVVREFDTTDPEVLKDWGILDGLYIDGKDMLTGPPISYEKIRRKIGKRVRKVSQAD
jgi:predicted N-acetyltransferase YhbS